MRSGTILAGCVLCAAAVAAGLPRLTGAVPQPADARPERVGVVDVYSLAERLVNSPEPARARDEANQAYADRMRPVGEQVVDLREQIAAFAPGTPEHSVAVQRHQRLMGELQSLDGERRQAVDRLAAKQLLEAYAKVRPAAVAVAQARGYTHLVASRGPESRMSAESTIIALQELFARPALMAPEEDDLTDEVASEMGLAPVPAAAEEGAPVDDE
jgi:hypothetical protein